MKLKVILLSGCLLCLILGCSTDNDTKNADQNINGNLTGKLFIGGDGEGWVLDLSTGRYSKIPGVDWKNENQQYHAMADVQAQATEYSGEEFLVKVSQCQKAGEDALSGFNDCLVVYGKDGEQKQGNYLFEDILGEPKLSRDSELMAFFYDHDRDDIGPALVVVSRDFEPVSAIPVQGYNVAPSLSWLPDRRIVYDRQQSIYITDTTYSSSSPIITFTEKQGEPRQVTVSPDGTKVAFILQTDATFRTTTATLWVINIDGTGLQQLAHVADGKRPSFVRPTWSPDGTKILFTHGYVAAVSNTDLGLLGGAYVVPANSDNILLEDDNPKIQHIQSFFGMKQGHSNAELTTDFSVKDGTITWLPD